MKRINKFFSVLFATIIVISMFTAVSLTASAAVDNSESTSTANDDLGVENIDFNVPLLTIVPVPAFTMDEVGIYFDMTVK